MLARGRAERDGDGKPVRLAGTLADVSERNRTDPLVGLPGLFALRAHVGRLVQAARRQPASHASRCCSWTSTSSAP